MQELFFFLVLIGLTIAFFNILKPFFTDIFLTVVLILLFRKPHGFFLRKFKGRQTLAASVTLLFVAVVIIIPLTFIGLMISEEATSNYYFLKEQWPEIQKNLTQDHIEKYVHNIPVVGEMLGRFKIEDFNEKINEIIGYITQFVLYLVQNTFISLANMLIHSFIVMFLMYYLLIDGSRLLKRVQYLTPLPTADEKELIKNLERVIDGIIINTFMLGAIEGVFGGTLFALLGIKSPVFWGFIMAMLSMIPIVGTNTILIGMAIFQFIIGNDTTAIIILSVGVSAVAINQHIIRPRLDGKRSGMHAAIAFIGSMGGLVWLGVIGFLAGPLIAALFITIWNQFGIKYQAKLEAFAKGYSLNTKKEKHNIPPDLR